MDVEWRTLFWRGLLWWTFLMTFHRCSGMHPSSHEFSHEDRLIKHLLRKYAERGRYGRPVRNYTEKLVLKFGMQLIQIMDLDERSQILTLNVWTHYNWTDIHLRWNKTEYNNVDEIHFDASEIWKPDLKLYNFADERLEERRDTLCKVKSNGEVTWIPQAVFKSSCEIDVTAFPFDKQKCHLKFGSWTYNGKKLDLEFRDNKAEMNLDDYQKSNVWHILEVPAEKNTEYYTCCPDEPYIDLRFYLIIRRKATFYAYTLILPCVLLTSLTLVLFWIPAESPAKLTLGMSTFMAFFILLIIFEDNLPPAATSFPLIGKPRIDVVFLTVCLLSTGMSIFMAYFILLTIFQRNIPPAETSPILGTYYCLNMMLITMSSFLCVFVVNMSLSGTRNPVFLPKTLKRVMFSYLARCLCMDALVAPFLEDTYMTCPSTSRKYVGVNGDGSKFTNEWKGSCEMLITLQKESNNELALIHAKVNEIRNFIKLYKERLEEKDRKDKIAKEWKVLALILDRIFFIVYLTTIIVSLMVVLPIIFSS